MFGVEFRNDLDRDRTLLNSLLVMRDEPAQMFMSLLRTEQGSTTPTAGAIASFVQAAAQRRRV